MMASSAGAAQSSAAESLAQAIHVFAGALDVNARRWSMPWERGTVSVDQVGRSLWIVGLRGDHDLSTVGDLHTQLAAIFAQGTTLVIDLSQATFIDSSIINELVASQRRVESDPNERLAVVAPAGGNAARVLELVNLGEILSIFQTREDALRSVDEL